MEEVQNVDKLLITEYNRNIFDNYCEIENKQCVFDSCGIWSIQFWKF